MNGRVDVSDSAPSNIYADCTRAGHKQSLPIQYSVLGYTMTRIPYSNLVPSDLFLQVAIALGMDMKSGRVDVSAHPMTCGMHPTDVRITTRCVCVCVCARARARACARARMGMCVGLHALCAAFAPPTCASPWAGLVCMRVLVHDAVLLHTVHAVYINQTADDSYCFSNLSVGT